MAKLTEYFSIPATIIAGGVIASGLIFTVNPSFWVLGAGVVVGGLVFGALWKAVRS